MTDKIPEALEVLDKRIDALSGSADNSSRARNRGELRKARAAFASAIDALWVSTEHNALYYGESHNTVITGRKALAAVEKLP